MSESGMDEELLFSSSPTQQRKNPDDEVRETVKGLLCSSYLNPSVENFLQDPRQKELFLEMFARQANLIKSRCQSFDDGHVTVYDKVLLGLTENGNRFDSVAAQEYFCEEFLGISKDGSPIEAEKILRQNLVLKAILAQAACPDGKYGDKYSAQTKYGDKGNHAPAPSAGAVTKDDEVDMKIARLTSIYEKAKSDFEAVPAGDTIAKLEAARFLRDTAENTVMYFRDPTKSGDGMATGSSHMKELMADLEATCKMAQASVVSLSGGRKRKFDKHDYEVFPRSLPGNGHGSNPGRRGSRGRGISGPSTRGYGAKKPQDTKREVGRGVEVPSPHSGNSREHHASAQRGFGYARPVDSYQPGGEIASSSHAHPYQPPQHHHLPTTSRSAMYGYDSGAQQQPGYVPSRHGRGHGQEPGYGYGYGSYADEQQYYGPGERQEGGLGGDGEGEGYRQPGRRGSGSYTYRRRGGGGVGGGGRGNGDGAAGGGYQPEMGY